MRGFGVTEGEVRRRWQFPVLLFALVWLSCVWFGSWAFNPNSATRLLAATAIVETGDARIDSFADMTIDKAMLKVNSRSRRNGGTDNIIMPIITSNSSGTPRLPRPAPARPLPKLMSCVRST